MTALNNLLEPLIDITWQNIRPELFALNPDFCAALDDLPDIKNRRLYRARYPFGARPIKNGILQLPSLIPSNY